MKAKHTPGPWACEEMCDGSWWIGADFYATIADVWTNEHDAKLVASAPTLKAQRDELVEALDNLRRWVADSFPVEQWPNGLMNEAEAVLHKVRATREGR